jgi:hypothetical protein
MASSVIGFPTAMHYIDRIKSKLPVEKYGQFISFVRECTKSRDANTLLEIWNKVCTHNVAINMNGSSNCRGITQIILLINNLKFP